MVLEDIKIRNFRCFNEFALSFGESATVIFGKNGSGKTTLIHALHKALSFIMYSDKIYATETVDGKKKKKVIGIRTITNNNPYLRVEGYSKSGDYNNHEDHLIELEANARLTQEENLNWKMSAFATNNRLRPSEFIKAFRKFYEWHKRTDSLPVLAYYSDCFPHKEDTKKAIHKQRISSLRNFGYFDWNDDEGCTKEWISRLERNIFNIRQGRDLIEKLSSTTDGAVQNAQVIAVKKQEVERWEREVNAIETQLKKFSRLLTHEEKGSIQIVGLGIHSEHGDLCAITTTGEEISFVHLPSGYKRLFSLVLDLTFRAYILNESDYESASGIAIVDEIDLHLHPGLEQSVVSALMTAFPKIQFIFTTHSPLVIANFFTWDTDTKVVSMQSGDSTPRYVTDAYGLDYDASVESVMGITLRTGELDSLVEAYLLLLKENLTNQAAEYKDLIMQLVGSEHEFLERVNLYKRQHP